MNHKKYEYIMDKKEISEFCTKSFLEQLKNDRKSWAVMLLVVLFLLLLYPGAAAFLLTALILLYLIIFLSIHSNMKKALSGKQWTVWIEDGRLKAFRDADYSEISCESMELVRITRRLLMLGYMLPDKRSAWIILPLRVFAHDQEREAFLKQLRNTLEEEEKEAESKGMQEQGCLDFAYMVNEERWVHFQMEADDMINGGTFGKTLSFSINAVLLPVFLAATVLWVNFSMGRFRLVAIGYSAAVTIILLLRSRYRSPQKKLKKQAGSLAVKNWECGLRRISLDEKGIVVCLPRGKNFYRWESMEWLVETEDAFYLFHKNKRSFAVIAKESFKDLNQVEEMHRLCGQKGLKKVSMKKRRHIPDWIFILALAAVFVLCMVSVVISAYRDAAKETERLSDAFEYAVEQETEDEEKEMAENIAKVPDARRQLEGWGEVLESTGLHVSEEAVESVWTAMTEYDLLEAVESDPYTWLLMYMAAPAYDEERTVREGSKELFWFDFEGMDLTTDYNYILDGMLELSKGSSLDGIKDIQVNTDHVDWEEGSGSIEVSLTYQDEIYRFDMDVEYDWIDSKVLGIFNSLLEPEGSEKLFYATWDGGQGAIVFFCTKEWKEQFEAKTGLELMCY